MRILVVTLAALCLSLVIAACGAGANEPTSTPVVVTVVVTATFTPTIESTPTPEPTSTPIPTATAEATPTPAGLTGTVPTGWRQIELQGTDAVLAIPTSWTIDGYSPGSYAFISEDESLVMFVDFFEQVPASRLSLLGLMTNRIPSSRLVPTLSTLRFPDLTESAQPNEPSLVLADYLSPEGDAEFYAVGAVVTTNGTILIHATNLVGPIGTAKQAVLDVARTIDIPAGVLGVNMGD